jgi:UDP-2-acetamido-3-amino-2,3-dideoxy-glucuronate N-acetyltransferase
VGNPGRQTGWVSEYGHKLSFDSEGTALCPESGQKYRLSGERVTKVI